MPTFFDDKNTLEKRWNEIAEKIYLTENDYVLDIGCAEGLISYEVAKTVRSVMAFDIDPEKIQKAKLNVPTEEKNKISFWVDDIVKSEFKYLRTQISVVLFLGVLHKLPYAKEVMVLRRIFKIPNRLVVIRVNYIDYFYKDIIVNVASEHGFFTIVIESIYKDQGHIFICRKFPFPV